MDKTTLGNRMKRYETTSQSHLSIRTPVIIRIDGKAFHTFTGGMERPFDEKFMNCMKYTTFHLVNNIEGCVFGYTQSDEISLLLIDYQNIKTQAWFDYNVQKLVSVSATIATAHFNREYQYAFKDDEKFAIVDARASNYPKEEEVVNYFIW